MSDSADFRVLKESLLAASRGPFFPDWEFGTLFGLQRAEVEAIAEAFSPSTTISGDVALAVHNAVNNLQGYPHQQEAAWHQWLSVTPSELKAVHNRIAGSLGREA
jgi:hypothetical protein